MRIDYKQDSECPKDIQSIYSVGYFRGLFHLSGNSQLIRVSQKIIISFCIVLIFKLLPGKVFIPY